MKNHYWFVFCMLCVVTVAPVGFSDDRPAVSELVKQLESKKTSVRIEALELLKEHKRPETIPAIIARITDHKSSVRLAAVEALSVFEDDQTRQALTRALKDDDDRVRYAAVTGIRPLACQEILSHLIGMLSDKHDEIRMAAVRAIARIKGRDAINALSQATNDDELEIRMAALTSLGGYGSAALPVILPHGKDRHSYIRFTAVHSLREIADESSVPLLCGMIDDDDHSVRVAVVCALGILGGTRADEGLIQALEDRDTVVRMSACRMLGMHACEAALGRLIDMMQSDPEQAVRESAAQAIARIGHEDALPAVTSALHKSYQEDRLFLMNAMMELVEKKAQHHPETKETVSKPITPSPSVNEDEKIARMKKHYQQAAALFKQGQYAEAITEWEKVLTLAPNHAQSKRMIQRAQNKLSQEAGHEQP
ncbi:MAG: tetratricopeptide repeat protein [Elusimicrobia bacterium]|nr:tetratricopeptide repeat protein [Elusimicrobiota bacterium]MBD3411543.1 tetratricopeptide repeat protein [Elusimicrobiota bacterium]